MKQKRQAVFYFRIAMAAIALLLPLLSLTVLGSLWLWQHGYVLYWALSACSITLVTYAIERWIFRVDLPETSSAAADRIGEQGDPSWSIREAAAWNAIIDLSNRVRPLEITGRDDIFDLGVRSIETVARSMHPGEEHALWKFTLPEAFALVERVSSQLSAFVSDSIPLGDRMTVGQFLRIYRWRSAIGVAEQAYDLWRIIRLMNPAAAATQEIREQLTRRAYDWGREELAKRLAQAYVREIGRAAIDLYSGRMRLSKSDALPTTLSEAPRRDRTRVAGKVEGPIRILIAGQAGSGKSSLITALLNTVSTASGTRLAPENQTAQVVTFDGDIETVLIESPAITGIERDVVAVLGEVDDCDLIVWVSSAVSPDHAIDKHALDAIRLQSASDVNRKPQPILCILTWIDAAPSGVAWSPPYDLTNTVDATVAPINAAIARAAGGLGFARSEIIPVSLRAGATYNIHEVQQRLVSLMPEADRVRHLRVLVSAKPRMKLGRIWSQVLNATRAIGGRVK